MSSLTLYIRRAELFHTEEYIKAAFYNNDYGLVSDVQFIKKSNDQGKEYNGAIVTFEHVFQSPKVSKLREELANTSDKTSLIVHDQAYRRYWIVQEYQEKEHDPQVHDPQVHDPQQFTTDMNVELLVIQLNQMKKKLERTESEMMNYEYERMRNALMNQELREQLEEKDEVIAKQQCKLVCMAIDLAKKESECEQLHNTLYEQQSVMRYIEEQAREMREMLHIGEECFDKGRMTVEELD
jgi:hypothetical protein